MGHVSKTPAGNYRANWRDPAGDQKAKTFKTKKAANAFLVEIEQSLNHGTYIDPNAGKLAFGDYAQRWLDARHVEIRTAERSLSMFCPSGRAGRWRRLITSAFRNGSPS
jgi:hypothetical protein